ncbi:electron transfer flavoprotein subunit alpha [Paractinoplanes abujensis]|uniref:Electron transfer flavoprotein alpha subunit n=1 Tax=Paractinoplanes abujensis TaxID=882441 RepID=A0A7W7D0Q6_9ACTN|nr:electron transfer flavoprotein subunit alpha/FixB family protein [Actinoplanes abujensis]MBB4697145.1 electron transfer flavoprotein alpha subunit [Actinoplanes abujensis]GID18381.1 electron transfer flavoprotein subunit alpha [Actinoplanes abujensis]
MAEVLVVVENGVKKVTLEMLTIARGLGSVSAVVFGEADTAKLGEYGAEKVYVASGDDVDGYLVAPKAAVLAGLVREKQPAAVLLASTQEGKEIAGRLAVKLDNGLLTDAVEVAADGTATQAVFAGSGIVKSKVTKGLPIVTIRPNSVTPSASPVDAAVSSIEVDVADTDKLTKVVERVVEQRGSRPELTEAGIVVSGGRGVGNADNFKLVEELADLLGGAVGASRAAVDSGYYPHQFQVGQTGKTVSPQLYVALGISGAIQHRAGMQTSKTIVAVNKDPEAPIFELADYGVVGDLFKIIPQAADEIRKRK